MGRPPSGAENRARSKGYPQDSRGIANTVQPGHIAMILIGEGNDGTSVPAQSQREFNINWGTLTFREKLTMDSASIFFYGQCESADK